MSRMTWIAILALLMLRRHSKVNCEDRGTVRCSPASFCVFLAAEEVTAAPIPLRENIIIHLHKSTKCRGIGIVWWTGGIWRPCRLP